MANKTSRKKDNKTEICSQCGQEEAMEAFNNYWVIKFKEDCKDSLEFFTTRLYNYGIDYKQYECGNAVKLNCKIISIEKEHVFIKVKGIFTLAIPLNDIEKMEEYEDEN